MSDPTAEERARQWLERQRATNADDLLDEGDCRFCGAAAGEWHEPTDPCGIVAGLLVVRQAANPELHVCPGCHYRWGGPLKGAELCGDCWRQSQVATAALAASEETGRELAAILLDEGQNPNDVLLAASNLVANEKYYREQAQALQGGLEHWRLTAKAAKETGRALREELARWQKCEHCGHALNYPGMCDHATLEAAEGWMQEVKRHYSRAEAAEETGRLLQAKLDAIVQMPRHVVAELAGDDPIQQKLLAAWDVENELRHQAEETGRRLRAKLEQLTKDWQARAQSECIEQFPGWVGAESAFAVCVHDLQALADHAALGESHK